MSSCTYDFEVLCAAALAVDYRARLLIAAGFAVLNGDRLPLTTTFDVRVGEAMACLDWVELDRMRHDERIAPVLAAVLDVVPSGVRISLGTLT